MNGHRVSQSLSQSFTKFIDFVLMGHRVALSFSQSYSEFLGTNVEGGGHRVYIKFIYFFEEF